MQKTILAPSLSPNHTPMTVVSCNAEPGQSLEAGFVLYELETDKIVTEVELSEAGRLVAWAVEEGEQVHAGEPIAVLESDI